MQTKSMISPSSKSELLAEIRASLLLAAPLALTQLSESGMSAVNAAMMGLLGTQFLAGGSLGAIAFLTLLMICYGILSVGGALAAEAFGANKIEEVGLIASQGLWLAAFLSIPAMLLMWHADSLLLLLGQEETNVLFAKTYLQTIVWGFPAALGLLVLKDVASAVNSPRLITVVMLAALLLTAPVNYIFMFGELGFPNLGLAGVGWGTTFVFWLAFIMGLSLLVLHAKVREYKLFSNLYNFDRKIVFEIFLLGWPVAFQFAGEMVLLNVTAWLMGYLGTELLAAHEIAIETAEICLVAPMAIGYAAMARVGQTIGEKNALGARRAAMVCAAIGLVFTSFVALILWLFPDRIVGIFLDLNDPDNTETIKTAITLLALAAIYQIFYGLQLIISSASIGLQDTRIPTLINLASWGIGLVGSYLMGITLGWGGIGIWSALAITPAISAAILIGRLYRVISDRIANPDNKEREKALDEVGASIT